MANIAVIVRGSQSEALRMSIGLTVLNDKVDIFITEKLKKNENSKNHLEAIRDLNLKVYSTVPDSGFEYITLEKMGDKLLEYDKVITY